MTKLPQLTQFTCCITTYHT